MLELLFLDGSRQGETIRLTFEKAWFGRQPTCDYVLAEEGVSRAHFSIVRHESDYVLIDNKSTNGTWVNRVRVTTATLRAGDVISAGAATMRVREVAAPAVPGYRFVIGRKGSEGSPQIVERPAIRLGRGNQCDLLLDDPDVAPVHAELERRPDGLWISDLSSGAGVYVNGQRAVSQQIRHGQTIIIQPFEIRVVLRDQVCLLSVRDFSQIPRTTPDLPSNYRGVVTAPSRRPAGEAKPSAAIAATPAWMQAKAPIWVPTSDILPNRFRSWLIRGCFLGALAWVGYAWAAREYSVFSPGPVAKYHSTASASFKQATAAHAGSSECAACHAGFASVAAAKCVDCHAKVYEAPGGGPPDKRFLVHQQRGIACAVCHREHQGPQFDAARTVGETCQSAGCHVTVHRKAMDTLAALPAGAPAPRPAAVSFEADWELDSKTNVHRQHKDARVKCQQCHVMPAKEEDEMPPVPRADMRMKCLGCHGFGPQPTLQARCYSCHFEHPSESPAKIAAPRPVEPPALASAKLLQASQGGLLFFGLFVTIPLFYFVSAAVRMRFDHRRLGTQTAASLVSALPAAASDPPPPLDATVPAYREPKSTDNQAPGGNLRPKIDLDLCVGCGSCVHVCPFGVLEIVNEKAIAARLGDCTGFAACAAECPTEAITLVQGGAMQTQELPVYDSHSLETNVPGLYLAGEVTGKALIKIAINQGKQVVDAILRNRPQPGDHYDVIVVGAGPAGTSAALAARAEGLRVLVLEQGTVANTIRNYPRQKFVMAEPVMIPAYGPLWIEDTGKEALLERWEQVIKATGLVIQEGESVLSVTLRNGLFYVETARGQYPGARVVMAIGKRGTARKLNVPGEDLSKVAYNLLDADSYRGKSICIVGGGDSSIEAAVGLARADLGNRVWLVHRGEDFGKAKARNQKKIRKAIEEKRVMVFFNSTVIEIGPAHVAIQTPQEAGAIPNDFVFVMAGGESPKKFLTQSGIAFSTRALG